MPAPLDVADMSGKDRVPGPRTVPNPREGPAPVGCGPVGVFLMLDTITFVFLANFNGL